MSASPKGGSGDTQELAALQSALPRAGDEIGAYRLVRLVGEGASGAVFEVEHSKIGRRAAMKVLSPEYAMRPSAVRRLISEAQAVNRINHPHIVEITDVIESPFPGGRNAIVMELLEGQSLAQLLVKQGHVPPARFVPILVRVADALAAAHAAGFIHRDLKPENIFLTARDGKADYVKLLDFGIAKSVGPDSAPTAQPAQPAPVRAHATVEGTFLGTPAYASPEQAAGKQVDHRTDLYSIGIILFELVHGRLPFEGQNLGEFLVKHLTMPPPEAAPEILEDPLLRRLDEIARRCLQKDPAARFHSAGEIRELLERVVDGDLPTSIRPAPRGGPRRLVTLGLVALVSAGGVGGLVAWLTSGKAAKDEARSAPVAPILAQAPIVRRVIVRFSSDPPGAETRRVGQPDLLGMTPFEQSFDVSEGVTEFEMTLPDHEPARFQVALTADVAVGGPLRPLPTGKARPAGRAPPRAGGPEKGPSDRALRPKRSVSKEATIDPFAR
jgi:serine/threonine-protein kinase